MYELNEQELEQVAGGWSINLGTQAQATGSAGAKWGKAGSSSETVSYFDGSVAYSEAANSSFAKGYKVGASSGAASTAGLNISE